MDQQKRENVLKQIRLEALSAIYLHQIRLKSVRRKNSTTNFLTIAVPILYFVPRFLLKDSVYHNAVEVLWELLASFLLILGVSKVVFRWDQKENDHSFMIHKNRDTAREALQLLEEKIRSNPVLQQFLKRVQDNDKRDNDELLLDVKIQQDQTAFRYALKHLVPGTTVLCPKCNADPWNFKTGSCQLCGNSPNNS